MRRFTRFTPCLAALLLAALAALPAAATCPAFICYLDLANGAAICPNGAVYKNIQIDPIVNTTFNPGCDPAAWHAAVVEIDLPEGCSCLEVTVEFDGAPEGWVVNLGDSPTNNGFGGDAGSAPAGQNAELDVLDDMLTLRSSATAPPVASLATQSLALDDGALKFVVKDQFISWGQPHAEVGTVDDRLFFLPSNPTPPANRTLYAAFNRVISPFNGPNGARNGCGASHVLMFTK